MIFVLLVPMRCSPNIDSFSSIFKITFSNGVSLEPVNGQCIPEDHCQLDLSAGLLVTDPGVSLGADGNLTSQIHGGYWQFITKSTLTPTLPANPMLIAGNGFFRNHQELEWSMCSNCQDTRLECY